MPEQTTALLDALLLDVSRGDASMDAHAHVLLTSLLFLTTAVRGEGSGCAQHLFWARERVKFSCLLRGWKLLP